MNRQCYSLLDHVEDALVISQQRWDQMPALMHLVCRLAPGKGCSRKNRSLAERAGAVRPGSRLGQSLKIMPPTVTALNAKWLLLTPPPAIPAEDMMVGANICTKFLFCG